MNEYTRKFVEEAEMRLEASAFDEEFFEREDGLLRNTVERMKSGQESLTTPETVDDWLERLRNHFP